MQIPTSRSERSLTYCLLTATVFTFLLFFWSSSFNSNLYGKVSPKVIVKEVKPRLREPKYQIPITNGSKWIVVTTVNYPTDDVKRLASLDDWNLVVVGDAKTPRDWKPPPSVHFLSVEEQEKLGFSIFEKVPKNSYTRKNIGYLYAISKGAEWIYDTDDDNKPYGKGLEQFSYTPTTRGLRFSPKNGEIQSKLFNPYRFAGVGEMWPRGFPLEHLENHTNGFGQMELCREMPAPAVQQGLVHKDPDVDAIYRLLHADRHTGLSEQFNIFTPPIALSAGTYAPWNSQNTLFHRRAFHTLLLPTTVTFRTTDIWRSYWAQALLRLAGDVIAFTPVNAVQNRNAHNYLADFKNEKQVYEHSGKIVEFIDTWKCSQSTMEQCTVELAEAFVSQKFWAEDDASLVKAWVEDLKRLGYQFPEIGPTENSTFDGESWRIRGKNCRPANLDLTLDTPGKNQSYLPAIDRAERKIKGWEDVAQWCQAANYAGLDDSLPTVHRLANLHANSYAHKSNLRNALIITNNYPWRQEIGLLQRLYSPYFGVVIFCGQMDHKNLENSDPYLEILDGINYIHIESEEMQNGFFGYICPMKARDLQLQNIDGYVVMSDDVIFNHWQRVDNSRVFHTTGLTYYDEEGPWYSNFDGNMSTKAIAKIFQFINETEDSEALRVWQQFDQGIKDNGYEGADVIMHRRKSWSVSDFYRLPSSVMDYFADLMEIFFENNFFHELAINKFLHSVKHQTAKIREESYLWFGDRAIWPKKYNSSMVSFHPVKYGALRSSLTERFSYCETILQTFVDILMHDKKNYEEKADKDPDYKNG